MMTLTFLACLTAGVFIQEAPFRIDIVALPFAADDALPSEAFQEGKFSKNGRLKATSLTDFAIELNRVKPTIFVAHLKADAWQGVNCYLETQVMSGTDPFTLASVSKLKPTSGGFELETIVSDGQLRSNLSFAGGKFNHRDRFKLTLGEIHYRLPRGKLKDERILLLFTVNRRDNS